ncbi:hypothetical protein FA13DRAFT_1749191 [Coprinellus micaceus]|uniref:Uncharacterized protein n=1 Tax=Coprinellus micaceus TaxID=71717 RepID=A0A4Y7RLC8_COPMI|nr:hypothetical protein FA13DRAFT_1749191 [Coprinellus micaceus]
MGPEIHAPSIFVRTFVWAPSEAMSDFYADRSRLDGGRPQGASSELSCDLDAVGGDMVCLWFSLRGIEGVTYL